MNCWKSINIEKDYGTYRLHLISSLIGLSVFIILFVPISMLHGSEPIISRGTIPFILALLLLPALHTLAHSFSLFIQKKTVRIKSKLSYKYLPTIHCYANGHLSKIQALCVMIMPSVLITIPGLIASLLLPKFFVYVLAFTAIHIGMTLRDFIYIAHILKAPKRAVVEDSVTDLDILVQANR